MEDRILPAPDVFASCPLEGNILDYYAGTSEAVFVSLNPFIRPAKIAPTLFNPSTYPNRAEIGADCEAVSWADIVERTGLPSLAAVDIGLRTQIRGLRTELMNLNYAQAISECTEKDGILPPQEGLFPDLLHDPLLRSLRELGYKWLWVGDEFCTERKLHWIGDLLDQKNGLTLGRWNVFTPEKDLLWTMHWDSHFSFLCSSREKLNAVRGLLDLEGFFCESFTEVYWSVH